LNFDPFDKAGESTETPETPESSGEVQETPAPTPSVPDVSVSGDPAPVANSVDGGTQGAQPTPNANASDQQVGGQVTEEVSGLRQQVAQLQGVVQALQGGMVGQQGQQAQGQPGQAPGGQGPGGQGQQQQSQVRGSAEQSAVKAPSYRYQIPEQTLAALRSDNDGEFGRAVETMFNIVAENVHSNLIQHVSDYVGSTVPDMIQKSQSAQGQQTQVRSDFYGAFPELNRPDVQPLVISAAQQLANEGYTRWDQNFVQALGQRVHGTLRGFVPAQAAPTPTPTPPKLNGPGAHPRPTGGSFGENSPDEIQQTLFGG